MSIKTNERELASKVAAWFQAYIDLNDYPFKQATNESGIKGSNTTKFGDIVLWKDRESKQAFTLLELKPPFGATENLKTLEEKANTLKVRFAYTWDFRNLNVYELKKGKLSAAGIEPTPVLDSLDEWLQGHKQASIKSYISRFCQEFVRFENTGKFTRFLPDKVYFVNLIRDFVNQLIPLFDAHIKLAMADRTKKAAIEEYVVKLGIAFTSEQEYTRLIAGQRVYGLATKIIFYLTIKRFFSDLPELSQPGVSLDAGIRSAFEHAREKDWQAVFEEGPIEMLGIPESSFGLFEEFFSELQVYHFGELPEDVIGELFQEIIDPEQRHTLGQYFTMESLVDFVIAMVVDDPNGVYSDPTCGSGTFLIRLYDRLKYLNPGKTHSQLLEQIWGFDIGSFPAELSTINLFRQDASNFENFPRVRTINIFDVHEGIEFDFPPPNAGKQYFKVKKTLPPISAFVGNFPFIRQELIEKKDPGFKKGLTKLLAYEYLHSYPQLFTKKNGLKSIKDNVAAEEPAFYQNRKQIDHWVEDGQLELKLSGKADLYAYIYIHLTTLLAKGGMFSIITSNSWLDTEYGGILKQFFLDHFNIKAIVASWAEPWFEDAAVNCVVTVLEREPDAGKRAENVVKFVKLKKSISEIVPHSSQPFERNKRWAGFDAVARQINSIQHQKKEVVVGEEVKTFTDGNIQVRFLNQLILKHEVNQNQGNSKWGKFLRAPEVYFELIPKLKETLVPLKEMGKVRFGIKSGINDFFYLQLVSGLLSDEVVEVENAAGWKGPMETTYLNKVIKSPKESEAIRIDSNVLPNLIFLCDTSKDDLIKLNHFHALHYIEWGESQRTKEGIAWPKVSSVIGRKLWYQINKKIPSPILLQMIGNDRFAAFLNTDLVHVDHNLFEYELDNIELSQQSEIYLNSTLFALIREVNSRANLGDGATKTEGVDWSNLMLIPKEKLNLILKTDGIFTRKVLPIFKEIKQKDRIELDTAVLESLGLDPKQYLEAIYEGLCDMVKDRQDLPKMRKKKKKDSTKFAYADVKASVIKEGIPNGFRRFPEEFLLNKGKLTFSQHPTNGKPLKLKEQFLGSYVLWDGKQIILTLDSEAKASYAERFTQRHPDVYSIPMPESKNDELLLQLLNEYQIYITDLTEHLRADAYRKLHDWGLAEKMAKEIVGE